MAVPQISFLSNWPLPQTRPPHPTSAQPGQPPTSATELSPPGPTTVNPSTLPFPHWQGCLATQQNTIVEGVRVEVQQLAGRNN